MSLMRTRLSSSSYSFEQVSVRFPGNGNEAPDSAVSAPPFRELSAVSGNVRSHGTTLPPVFKEGAVRLF